MTRLALVTALALAACTTPALSDDIVGGEWHLIGVDRQPVAWSASLSFAEDGQVSGKAPCNRYFGKNGAALPSLALGALGATRMACPDLDKEAAYFEALAGMTTATIDQGHLVLTGGDGRMLEFVRDLAANPPCRSCLAGQ